MASSIYLSSAEAYTGKSAIALGLVETLARTAGRVGVFRPIVHGDPADDDVLGMLLEFVDPTLGLTAEECSGVTYEDVHDDPDRALAQIISDYKAIERRCDTVVIVGSDFTDVGNPAELSFNARIAANLGSRVVQVIAGRNAPDFSPRTVDEVESAIEATLRELSNAHAELAAVVVNRCDPHLRDEIIASGRDAVERAIGRTAPVWVVPEDSLLDAPSVSQIQAAVDGTLYSGDESLLGREVLGVVIAGMAMEHVLDRLIDGGVIILAADRTEMLLAVLLAQRAENFPSVSCIVVNGPFEFSPTIERMLQGLDASLPIIRTQHGTFDTAQRIMKTRGRVGSSRRKIDAVLKSFAQFVPADELEAVLDAPGTSVVTPLMFEYGLLDRARANRKHIVLPEGDDDRILQAAATLLARDVADLTILGEEADVRSRAASLGVDIEAARIVSPRNEELIEQFAEEYAKLRAHKGVTLEQAQEKVTDVSYFGTLMVHMGLADGMVSGAAHTTAHTIKPGFEIVKTKPGVSIVSSVFLMALADRVLVYGDCAVNPDPTAEQLADIAISSAETATQFGIEPRVAMLSYSTGDSGSGADVDKVREATALVKERRPDLLVDGPIQYDAATDPQVATKKMPDSPVAGQATVFIFPDLNTGNNTYKAVQRSAGAVAIGPVLQGLNAPINDLSRGALVSDIVNTVAITAIQAQATDGDVASDGAGAADDSAATATAETGEAGA